ncbi:unnamed protein product [Prorocentrum cordatum]|uniref:Uncharacterized protein n=1 Tax=Prorocentrum cordatum TaxID=2364126 RepID=A0ABN9WZK2_9DINO|nr:unnamed protein product [Polarella glacialis]
MARAAAPSREDAGGGALGPSAARRQRRRASKAGARWSGDVLVHDLQRAVKFWRGSYEKLAAALGDPSVADHLAVVAGHLHGLVHDKVASPVDTLRRNVALHSAGARLPAVPRFPALNGAAAPFVPCRGYFMGDVMGGTVDSADVGLVKGEVGGASDGFAVRELLTVDRLLEGLGVRGDVGATTEVREELVVEEFVQDGLEELEDAQYLGEVGGHGPTALGQGGVFGVLSVDVDGFSVDGTVPSAPASDAEEFEEEEELEAHVYDDGADGQKLAVVQSHGDVGAGGGLSDGEPAGKDGAVAGIEGTTRFFDWINGEALLGPNGPVEKAHCLDRASLDALVAASTMQCDVVEVLRWWALDRAKDDHAAERDGGTDKGMDMDEFMQAVRAEAQGADGASGV